MRGSSEEESIVQRIHKMWIDGRHANLIRVYRHGPIQGSVYGDYAIDMELCDYNLEIYLNKEQDLLTTQIFFIMSHLTEGIRFLHEQAIVYGRLKPKNGNLLSLNDNSNISSIVFNERKSMENCRIRI